VDFAYRAWCAGQRMIYNPRAASYHYDYAVTRDSYCQREYQAGLQAATILFIRYPDLVFQIPMFADKLPLSRHDPTALVMRKIVRRVLSWSPAFAVLNQAANAFEHLHPRSMLLRHLYRLLVGCYCSRGYLEGCKRIVACGRFNLVGEEAAAACGSYR